MTQKERSSSRSRAANVTDSRARLQVEYVPIAALVPYAKNARTHSAAQVTEIARSIERFGFVNPVLVDDSNTLIAGHGRLLAAERLGMDEVPVIRLNGLSASQRRALALADNRIALNSGWDAELLRGEIEALRDADEDVDGLGFGKAELDALFEEDSIEVVEVQTGDVDDRFWVSLRGPLADQAEVLRRLQKAMADMPDVEVELGTTAIDAI